MRQDYWQMRRDLDGCRVGSYVKKELSKEFLFKGE